MKRFSLRIAVAFLTFTIGLYTSTAMLARTHSTEDPRLVTPPPTNDTNDRTRTPALEMVFVLDTTGSMGGLIEGAKQRIWGIVNEVMQASSHPSVRVGLVAYRDRGDAYVTQVLPLTNDLDKVYTTLMDYRADGGGDTPENVRRALADAVNQSGWSAGSAQVAQVIFLVGDAPPSEYADEPDALTTTSDAVRRGMTVNTIQCGDDIRTRDVWQTIARRGEGQFFAIAQDGGVATITTPYDARLSELGGKLGQTYLAYGGGAGTAGARFRAEAQAVQMKTETRVAESGAPVAAADRAVNKALNRDAYVGDLLQSLENESVKLDSVKTEDLPDELQKLSPEERKKEVEKRLAERRKIRSEIVTLSKQRDEFIAAERKKRAGGKDGFDAAVATALKQQMARRGIK